MNLLTYKSGTSTAWRVFSSAAVTVLLFSLMDRLWLPYDERQNHHVQPIVPAWAFLAGVALMAFAACRHMRAPRQLLVPTSMLLTLWAAETLLIGVDVIQDPTSHNLAPLEYVFLMILMLPAYVGAVVAMVLDKRENRHPGAN